MKKERKTLTKNKGVVLTETILMTAISLVLVVILFYPQISNLITTMLNHLDTWFTNAIGIIGVTG